MVDVLESKRNAAGSLADRPLVDLLVYSAKKKLSGHLRLIGANTAPLTVLIRNGVPTGVLGLPEASNPLAIEVAIGEVFRTVGEGSLFEFYSCLPVDLPPNPQPPFALLWRVMRGMPEQACIHARVAELSTQRLRFSAKTPLEDFEFDRQELLAIELLRVPNVSLPSFLAHTSLPLGRSKKLIYLLSVTGCLVVLVATPVPAPSLAASSFPAPPLASEGALLAPVSAAPPYLPEYRAPMPQLQQESALSRFRYLAFAGTLLPLAFSLLGSESELSDRLLRTLVKHPELADIIDKVSDEQLFIVLPEGRLDGAFLSHYSHAHWLFAPLSAFIMIVTVFWLFDKGNAKRQSLVKVVAFTATGGMVVLLAIQLIAAITQHMWLRGASLLTLVFYVFKIIGYSYRAALDPKNGFIPSFAGFMLGVGLCEEVVKFIPVIWYFRTSDKVDWRSTCLWGLASGIGFGVSEGVTYSSDFYNGISGGGIYLVRFVSCVGLHAIWSGTVAIMGYRRSEEFRGSHNWKQWSLLILTVVFGPMVLHAFYDTLLKREMNALALIVALISFAVFAVVVEREKRKDEIFAATFR